jgi:hypothetical protein
MILDSKSNTFTFIIRGGLRAPHFHKQTRLA